ncbi:hypothetical protein ACFX2C_001383 [Malus domestica]
MEQSKGRRVILFPLPFQSPTNSMLELADVLHPKGFSITIIYTRFNSLNPSTLNPNFTHHSIPIDLSETEVTTKDVNVILSCLNDPVACLISDTYFHFTRSLAESFKLPRIMLETVCATTLVVYAAFPLLKEKGYFPIQDSRLKELVTELSPTKVKDLPTNPNCDPEKLYQLVVDVANELKSSYGLILNTFEDLEGHALATIRQEHLPNVPIFPVGPFHKCCLTVSSSSSLLTQDQSCISWLNTQAPTVANPFCWWFDPD